MIDNNYCTNAFLLNTCTFIIFVEKNLPSYVNKRLFSQTSESECCLSLIEGLRGRAEKIEKIKSEHMCPLTPEIIFGLDNTYCFFLFFVTIDFHSLFMTPTSQ